MTHSETTEFNRHVGTNVESRPVVSDDEDEDYCVEIVGGTYKGSWGIWVRDTNVRVVVQIGDKEHCLARHNVRFLSSSSESNGPSKNAPLRRNTEPTTNLTSDGTPSLRRSLRLSSQEPLELYHHLLGLREDFVELVAPGRAAHCQKTLAFLLFGHRLRTMQFPLCSDSSLPTTSREADGSIYELLSVKLIRPESSSKKRSAPKIRALYVLTSQSSSTEIPALNVPDVLERYANFSHLTTEKVVARLELLQSTACMHNRTPLIGSDETFFTLEDFEEIPERAHEGCGFIPEHFVHRLLGSGIVGRRTLALQVRILAPQLGLFKGLLVVKPGISRIQLPSSMQKVKASVVVGNREEEENTVLFLVNGKFPSDVNALHLPKLFRGEMPAKSFKPKALNDMILRLWQDWPIPAKVIHEYAEQSLEPKGLEHTCLVGLADPTDGIPAGMVFITGFQNTPIPDTIFVTRYPCTEATTDGHLITVLRERPLSMNEATWKWITALAFGGIIFGNPASLDEEPIPGRIAQGDLDGDLYFVCWNFEILSHCKAVRSVGLPLNRRDDAPASTPLVNPHWWRDGQERMSDLPRLASMDSLICQLYHTWKQKDTKGDFVYFGRAYKNALDIGKHGGCVFLPHHLWGALPSSLHRYLTATTH